MCVFVVMSVCPGYKGVHKKKYLDNRKNILQYTFAYLHEQTVKALSYVHMCIHLSILLIYPWSIFQLSIYM